MTATTTPTDTKSNDTPKPKAKAPKASTVSLSSIYARKASKLGIDTTRAAKLVRSKLRSNFDKVCELDPQVKKAKKSANDGNRWPTHVSKSLAEFLNA